jgi:cell fate (sporulation/competence/biofilm development) regulator YlbF (YheA/YmcA/DUF963 family)
MRQISESLEICRQTLRKGEKSFMTYEDALKASKNGLNVMIWTGEEYLRLEEAKEFLNCSSHVIRSSEEYKGYKKFCEAIQSDKWSTYTEIDLRWELRNYRKRFERLSRIQDDFLKELLGSNYTARYSSEQMIVADAFNTLYSLKRNQKIFMLTTIVFLATTIIALIV